MSAVSDVFSAARQAGFNDAEALIMTAASFFESGYGAAGSGGNHGGLLQFEPSTWAAARTPDCPATAPTVGGYLCQMKAAKNLANRSGFISSFISNWYTWEHAQGGTTMQDYANVILTVAQQVGVNATGALGLLNTKPSQAAGSSGSIPVISGIGDAAGAAGNAVGSVSSGLGGTVSGAAGNVGNALVSPLVGRAKDLAGYVGPLVLLAIAGVTVGWFILKSLELSGAKSLASESDNRGS